MKISMRITVWMLFCSLAFLSACGGGGGGGGGDGGATAINMQASSSAALSSVASSTDQLSSSSKSGIAQSSFSSQSSVDTLGYAKQAIFDDWFYEVTGYPNEFNFYLYVPITYQQKPDAHYPVVIVLHGDNGYTETRPKLTPYPLSTGVFNSFVLGSGELTRAGRASLNAHLQDAFVIHPEIPHIDRAVFQGERLGWWNPAALNNIVAYLVNTYRIDEHRIYVVGASMGGAGTFYYAATNPQKIAAIAPVSNGLYDYLNTSQSLRDMPIWLFEDYDDDTVQFLPYVLPTVNQLAGQDVWEIYPGSKPPTSDYTISYSQTTGLTPWVLGSDNPAGVFNFTLYATGGHDAWDKTFAKSSLWDWLFLQKSK